MTQSNKFIIDDEIKANDKHKSSDDETCMSSLALIEDSIEPYLVPNTSKSKTVQHNGFDRNSANINADSFEKLMIKRDTMTQSPLMSKQRPFFSETAPLRAAGNHSTNTFTPFEQGGVMRTNHDLYWYSDPPPPPPPFPSG